MSLQYSSTDYLISPHIPAGAPAMTPITQHSGHSVQPTATPIPTTTPPQTQGWLAQNDRWSGGGVGKGAVRYGAGLHTGNGVGGGNGGVRSSPHAAASAATAATNASCVRGPGARLKFLSASARFWRAASHSAEVSPKESRLLMGLLPTKS